MSSGVFNLVDSALAHATVIDHVPGDALAPVRFSLDVRGVPDVEWQFVGAQVRTALSEVYELRLDMAARDVHVDLRALLGTRVTLTVHRGRASRPFHAVVHRVEDWGQRMDGAGRASGDAGSVQTVARVFAGPELWLLSKRTNSRVFHHAHALDIVRAVLAEAGLYVDALDVSGVELGKLRAREYCVQYQETDLDFVRRLLEDEGFAFYFRQDADRAGETLVIVDGGHGPAAFSEVSNGDRGRVVESVAEQHHQGLNVHQTVSQFGARATLQSSGVLLRDFDFTNFRARGDMVATRGTDPSVRAPLTVYEYPANYVFTGERTTERVGAAPGDGAVPRNDEHNGRRLAALRHEELRAGDLVFEGRANVIEFDAGKTFELAFHERGEYDQRYLLTGVTHTMWSPEHPLHGGIDPQKRALGYASEFTAIPARVPFRPRRNTPKPRIAGPQTALVVGGPRQEILTDYYGRIKVQFHWDLRSAAYANETREGAATPQDANPYHLCWARVAQAWAGAGWGAMFVPRVGMEVVVAFLDGDPDRPLVVGCVYNDANPPPYALPQDASRSTIRTRSTPVDPDEERYNELRFEDARHNEEVYLRAQRDLNEWVGREHNTDVMADQNNRVRASQTVTVDARQTIGVGGCQSVTVGVDQSTVVRRNRTEQVDGDHRETVVGCSSRSVIKDELVTVYGARTTVVHGGDHTYATGPIETVIQMPPVPDPKDPESEGKVHPDDIEYLESRTVKGSRYTQVDAMDEQWAQDRNTVIEGSEKHTVQHQYTVNTHDSLNMLVTKPGEGTQDAVGVFVDRDALRMGTRREDAEEVLMFRGSDGVHLGTDEVLVQASEKPLEFRIGDTGCVIRLSKDGKNVQIVGLETIELVGAKSSISIGKDIVLASPEGKVKMGTKK